MGRELLRQIQNAIEGHPRKRSILVNDEHNSDDNNGDTDYKKEIENCSRKHPDWELSVHDERDIIEVKLQVSI